MELGLRNAMFSEKYGTLHVPMFLLYRHVCLYVSFLSFIRACRLKLKGFNNNPPFLQIRYLYFVGRQQCSTFRLDALSTYYLVNTVQAVSLIHW